MDSLGAKNANANWSHFRNFSYISRVVVIVWIRVMRLILTCDPLLRPGIYKNLCSGYGRDTKLPGISKLSASLPTTNSWPQSSGKAKGGRILIKKDDDNHKATGKHQAEDMGGNEARCGCCFRNKIQLESEQSTEVFFEWDCLTQRTPLSDLYFIPYLKKTENYCLRLHEGHFLGPYSQQHSD